MRNSGLRPTKQRILIAQNLFDRDKTFHFTVETLNKEINKLNANKEETKISEPESNNEMQQIASDIKGF